MGGAIILVYGLFTGKLFPNPGTSGTGVSEFGGNASADWLPKGTAPTPSVCQPGFARDTFGICHPVAKNGACPTGLVFDPATKLCLPPKGSF